jgi:hypothetical protein
MSLVFLQRCDNSTVIKGTRPSMIAAQLKHVCTHRVCKISTERVSLSVPCWPQEITVKSQDFYRVDRRR